MTDTEKQEILNLVLTSLRTNSKTIEQLTPATTLSNNDKIEIGGGRYTNIRAIVDKCVDGVEQVLPESPTIRGINDEIDSLKSQEPTPACPRIYNPPAALTGKTLRVLCIGDDHTPRVLSYLGQLASNMSVNTDTYRVYALTSPEASFATWVDIYGGLQGVEASYACVAGTLLEDVGVQTFALDDGDPIEPDDGDGGGDNPGGDGGDPEPGGETPDTPADSAQGAMQTALRTHWDVIVLCPGAAQATDASTWWSAGRLRELIEILRTYQPGAAIALMMPHSYAHDHAANTERSTSERWRKIASATRSAAAEMGVDVVIPVGTAIENLRMTSLNTARDLTSNGSTLADGIARYAASCVWWESILAPHTGRSLMGNSVHNDAVGLTSANAAIAKRAAMRASTDRFTINNPR